MRTKSLSIFGDLRLEKGFQSLIEKMSLRHTAILRQLSEDRKEEIQFGRFINNKKVTPKHLVSHSCKNTSLDLSEKNVLVLNDSSILSFEEHANRKGLSYVGPGTKKRGFKVHPAMLLDADTGACYGLGGITFHRTELYEKESKEAKKLKKQSNQRRPFEDKERYKWFDAPRQAIENYPNAKSYTLVGDREADIYTLIAKTQQNGWEYIYRSKTDRTLCPGDKHEKLYDAITSWPVVHSFKLALPKTKKRTKHEALLDVKYGQVQIAKPLPNKDKDIADHIKMHIVEVKEKSQTVVGNEKPVHWILLTSHPVHSVAQALQIVEWYTCRWAIEQLFRTIKKKGLNIEQSTVETYEGLANLTTMALLAAIQVMQLVQARDGDTLQKMEEVFFKEECHCLMALNNKVEGKTNLLKNPHLEHSLAYASWIIARLGGWKGYKSESPPGPVTIIRGLSRFYDILEGYLLLTNLSKN